MPHCFILCGNDRKIKLENATHPCPRCKRPNTVQLTRYENELIVFNRKIALPNNMIVRYGCNQCKWKNQNLPESDPSNQLVLSNENNIDYFPTTNHLFVGSNNLVNKSASFSSSSSDLNSATATCITKPYANSLYRPASKSSWKQKKLFLKRASCS
ncbi:hypothetical protein INT46_003694 [Mucor plumbeus]|uniref:Uncharacterized protein n=1 Tax=Mucor plumbeus TaxID=97098 RepID=A0A8H7QK95_9FUNG|nr:hypothetical protein INT46_003694 [Mucor plumbeus]